MLQKMNFAMEKSIILSLKELYNSDMRKHFMVRGDK